MTKRFGVLGLSYALITSMGALALTAGLETPANADGCLLDRDNDGVAQGVIDFGTDDYGEANLNFQESFLACRVKANATGPDSTASDSGRVASGVRRIAIGGSSEATGLKATGIGILADVTAIGSIVIGGGSPGLRYSGDRGTRG